MPAGFCGWPACVAPLRGRGWLSAGLCDYELACWSQTCRMLQSVGAEPGQGCFPCLGSRRVGRCRVFRVCGLLNLRTCECAQ